jgi:hypothetical protein
MPSKVMSLLAVSTTTVAVAALAAPSSALAKHKKPSAVDVYVEQVPTASGHQAPPTATTSGAPAASSSAPVPLTSQAKRKLQSRGGKDAGLLAHIATHPGFDRKLASVGETTQPGTFDAAFDLGAGPTVLFALVLGTALFVAVGGGLRGWRRRRLH